MVEIVVEVYLAINNKINKIKTMEKMQDMVEEKKIREQGEAQEEEVDGNRD